MRLQQVVDQAGDSKPVDPDIRRHEGDTVDFQVTVDADSVPFEASLRFVWTKNECEVRLGARYGVHQSPRGSRLRIIDLSTVDTGRYTCHVAVSTAGRVSNGSCKGLEQDAVFNLSVDEQEMNDVVNLRDRIRNLHNRTEQREMNRQARRSIKRPYQCRHPLHHHEAALATQRLCSTVEAEESRDPTIDNAPTTSDAFRFWAINQRAERHASAHTANEPSPDAGMNSQPEHSSRLSPSLDQTPSPQLPTSSPPPRLPRHNSSFSSSCPGSPATPDARGKNPPTASLNDAVPSTVNNQATTHHARPSVIAVSATLNNVVTSDEVESPLINVSTTLDEVVTSHDVALPPTIVSASANNVVTSDDFAPPPVSISATLDDAVTSDEVKSPPVSVSASLNDEEASKNDVAASAAVEDEETVDDVRSTPPAASMSQDTEVTSNDLHAAPIASSVNDKTEAAQEQCDEAHDHQEISEKAVPETDDVKMTPRGRETPPPFVVALVDDVINTSMKRVLEEASPSEMAEHGLTSERADDVQHDVINNSEEKILEEEPRSEITEDGVTSEREGEIQDDVINNSVERVVESQSEITDDGLTSERANIVQDDVINNSVERVVEEEPRSEIVEDGVTSEREDGGGDEVQDDEAAVVNVDLSQCVVDDMERKSSADDDGIAIRRRTGEGGMSERAQSGVQFRHEQLPPEEIPFPDRVVETKVGVDPWQEYEKLEKIGSGGFSEVFRCRERATGLDLAAKVARYRASNKSSLLYEIDILSKLCHPRVMRLYDVFDHSRRMVLITEYVGGGELCERIIEDNFLSEEQACNFVVQILRGVSYLHKQSIIHLDLKPENIVCTTKSSYDIKIIDFGFAQRYEGEQKPIRFLGGTANFTAPEVINYEPLTFAADVWAVGVIAFLLLSGYAPFDGDSDQEVLVNVTKGNFDYDDEVFDEISTTAREFIDKILVKNPSKRPTSHELLRDEWLRARGRRSTLHLPSTVTHMRCYLNRAREKWKAATTAIMAMQKFRRTQA